MLERSSIDDYRIITIIRYSLLRVSCYTYLVAILKQTDDGNEIVLKINNGDLSALREIEKEWNFEDESGVFRFALAVLTKAKNKSVYVEEDGKKVALTPGDKLLKREE